MSGPFGPLGSEAVVMTGTFISLASFARVVVLVRSSATGTSLTVWKRPAWWSSRSTTVSAGSSSDFGLGDSLRGWACGLAASRNPDRQDRGQGEEGRAGEHPMRCEGLHQVISS